MVISFLIYCFVQGITPGPANLLSLSTAMIKGRQTALRQWTGIFIGFFADSLAAAFLVYFTGSRLNDKMNYFVWVGAAYIIFLAVRMLLELREGEKSKLEKAGSENSGEGKTADKKNGFLTGFITQITNVKVIVFCITAIAGYVMPYTDSFLIVLLVALFLPFTGPVCNLVWLFAGVKMQKLFVNHKKLINIIMAVALIGCALHLVLSVYI